ncbi:bifunctional sugar phosphate isomerase/epimerase/4-hydroxyphenylpyruvate dioxygenase family protein [Sneathiella limimaris]|uniref:bifunctional sugar phosphate isomerase/epimerase/4-hydroxyphenylpyruvate dioxygenase family protein n=1 Tax=Sneathiella limimaris TaxID=1964213 RepID=UPI00146A62BC|nr:sugar phosphate isomerase/epimerase and 4-hydroxyphenylpyruvate domain-containing protein [Sneathiella limimaris]
MKTSIATVSIAGDFQEKLTAIANAGFDGIEIFENDFLAFDGSPTDVGNMIRDMGLEITLFQPFRDFEGMPSDKRQKTMDRAERKFDLMQELGTDLILICSNISPHSLGGIDRAAEDFFELGERAAKRKLRIGFEALAWGRHINDHRDAWEVVRRANHDNVGIILDSFHTLARKIDPNSIRSIPGDKIFIVQLADAPLIDMDLLYWSRHFRNMPGEGDLAVTDFMKAVAATGYQGPISLEIFNDQFRSGSPKSIAVDGHRSLIYLMDQVARQEPDVEIDLPAMPDRILVKGIEFIEFAADEREAEELTKLLETLGFRLVGKHISKDVTRWRQGDINVVINTEQEGFAHSSYILRGTTVCAIGLKVEDAKATTERAKALNAELFSQPVGPGELTVPSIRGVGGSVIYFLDDTSDLGKIWDIEFLTPETVDELDEAGLISIDHLAQTMNYEDILTWLLFYTSIFNTLKKPMVDVVDPAGLVRSQVVENTQKSFRLTLNGAENHRTLAGHFIKERLGSAVQHVAFSTNDIFKTLEDMRARGFKPLQISQNYYDDLEARFDLDNDLSTKLRQNNILYDKDDDGEYFQVYSQTYGEGFFFEVVERRGGYDGYGAPNAQFRITAQKQHLRPTTVPKDATG